MIIISYKTNRISWISISSLMILLFGALCLSAAEPRELQGFLSSTRSSFESQKTLKSDSSLSGFNIKVYGQHREFDAAVKHSKAKFVLAPSSFQRTHKEYKVAYRFTREGKEKFRYLLLSLKKDAKLKDLAKSSIGVVDQLGRREMKKYVEEVIGTCKKVRRVTKPEDLMPLLILGNADFILISPKNYEVLKRKYKTKTFRVSVSKEVGYPAVYARKELTASEIDRLKLNPATVKSLGFTGLKKEGEK